MIWLCQNYYHGLICFFIIILVDRRWFLFVHVFLLFLVGDEREVWGLLMAVTIDLVLYMPVFGLEGNVIVS